MMTHFKKYCVLLVLGLAGCGGGGAGDDILDAIGGGNGGGGEFAVHAFQVTGTDGDTVRSGNVGEAVLSPFQNQGGFSMDWHATGGITTTGVTIYLTSTANPQFRNGNSTPEDSKRLYHTNCGVDGAASVCAPLDESPLIEHVECVYGSDSVIDCGNHQQVIEYRTSIGQYLTNHRAASNRLFLALVVCQTVMNSATEFGYECKYKTVPVRFY